MNTFIRPKARNDNKTVPKQKKKKKLKISKNNNSLTVHSSLKIPIY